MKSILLSIKPKWCAEIMNGNKTIEIRKNKALSSAIQKLIDENGYADIYVYCSKNGVDRNGIPTELVDYRGCAIYNRFRLMGKGIKLTSDDDQPRLNGKVLFKFRCYKIEHFEYDTCSRDISGYWLDNGKVFKNKGTCLTSEELFNYIKDKDGYAIHISKLEIFDRPKELKEFSNCDKYPYTKYIGKAPQNYCYIEGEKN